MQEGNGTGRSSINAKRFNININEINFGPRVGQSNMCVEFANNRTKIP